MNKYKICSRKDCEYKGEKQNIENFFKRSDNNKLRSQCKRCQNKYVVKHKSTLNGYIKGLIYSAKRRCSKNKREINISYEDVLKIWENQEGFCAISGIKMSHIIGNDKETQKTPFNASLDRRDNKKGYTKDNIHLICNWLQSAKSDYEINDIKKWIVDTAEYIKREPEKIETENNNDEKLLSEIEEVKDIKKMEMKNSNDEKLLSEIEEVKEIKKYKNQKKENKCLDCSVKISKNAKRCVKCNRINSRKIERPPLDILLKDIEKLGYKKTGEKYSVSDNTIRKWVKT